MRASPVIPRAGGLACLPEALRIHEPGIVVIELGGNDGLRGLDLKAMHRNLVRMVEMSHDAGASVLLLGVRLPANYGNRCGDRFRQVYRDVASETGAPLVDFFLEGVAETTALMQADGIHPSAAAQPRILENVWRALKPLLMKMTASSDVASHPDPPLITQNPLTGAFALLAERVGISDTAIFYLPINGLPTHRIRAVYHFGGLTGC